MPPEAPHLLHEATGERTPLKARTTLGRSADNDVVLADTGCSNHHAIIHGGPQGWVVEDLGSTNGTWVNGEWVQGSHALGEGDLLQVGNLRFRAQALSAPLSAAARPAPAPGPTVILSPPAKEVRPEPPASPPTPSTAPPAPRSARKAWAWGAGLGALVLVVLMVTVALRWRRSGSPLPSLPAPTAAPTTSVKPQPNLPPKLDLLREATRFRGEAMGTGLVQAVEHQGGAQGLKVLTDSPVFQKAPALWSYFFSGSVILGGCMESPAPVIAYYNPYLDGVLLTQWEMKEGKAVIRNADLRIASRMAGQPIRNPKLAWWIAELAVKPLPVALKTQYAAFLAAFARAFPVEAANAVALGTSPEAAEARTILERQAIAAFANLAYLQDPKALAHLPGLVTLRQALASGDALILDKLLPPGNPVKGGMLAAQPGWIRREAVPVYALAGAKHTLVLLAPIAAPRYYLFTRWSAGTPPILEHAAPFDMDAGLTPTPRKAPGEGGKP